MALVTSSKLRDRMRERYVPGGQARPTLLLPSSGRISDSQLVDIQLLATRAKAGDCESRDTLYFSFAPRLHRIGNLLKPWPNTFATIGVWDQDDVDQEGYLIFTELLLAWDEQIPFVPFLLGRFVWRLRDRILRGIGKPNVPRKMVPVHELSVLELLPDGEEPESALAANEMLRAMVRDLASRLDLQGDSDSVLRLLSTMRLGRHSISTRRSGSHRMKAA